MYGPNSENANFFKQISTHIDNIANTDIIICGNYNCVLNPELDYYNHLGTHNAKARKTLLHIINEKYLIDPLRENYLPLHTKRNLLGGKIRGNLLRKPTLNLAIGQIIR